MMNFIIAILIIAVVGIPIWGIYKSKTEPFSSAAPKKAKKVVDIEKQAKDIGVVETEFGTMYLRASELAWWHSLSRSQQSTVAKMQKRELSKGRAKIVIVDGEYRLSMINK